MTCLNCGCQTRKSELTRRTWLRRHILRLWLHPMLPSSGSLFYLCVCLCVCHCSGFTPGEDRQLLCGGEDAGEGQPISRRATETAPVWSECQHKTGHLLLPPLDETRAIAGHTNTHSHTVWYWFNAGLFQELECAVSVEEDNRQEWTFTLYDFDNSGKVTREVIACFSGKAFNCLMNK